MSTRWTTRRCCSSTSNSGADVTVGCLEATLEEAKGFGVMHVDDDNTIIEFLEKPKNPPPMPGKPDVALCSMGIYVFETSFLIELLKEDAADPEFEPRLRQGHHSLHRQERQSGRAPFLQVLRALDRGGASIYWRDVGTVDAYWEANIDLTDVVPDLDLYDRGWPIWTYGEITPPAKFVHDVDGRRGLADLSRCCRAAASSRARRSAVAGLHRRARPFLFDHP